MIQIKIGENQPIDCENCQNKQGYMYSDLMRTHYTTYHQADGLHDGGSYSESSRIINNGVTPYCTNCGSKLNFKLIRENTEILKTKKYVSKSYFF